MLPGVTPWGGSYYATEDPGEMALVAKTQLGRDFDDRKVLILQKMLGLFNSFPKDELMRREVGALFEHTAEVVGT